MAALHRSGKELARFQIDFDKGFTQGRIFLACFESNRIMRKNQQIINGKVTFTTNWKIWNKFGPKVDNEKKVSTLEKLAEALVNTYDGSFKRIYT